MRAGVLDECESFGEDAEVVKPETATVVRGEDDDSTVYVRSYALGPHLPR